MEVKKSGQSLRLVFLKYLISIGIALVVSVILAILLFNLLFLKGYIVPSNYTENLILENKRKIEESVNFDEELIPDNVYYVFLSKEANVIKSNMDDYRLGNAIKFHNGELRNTGGPSAYMEFSRKDGNVIFNYSVKPYYANEWMDDNLPSINVLFAVILVIVCLLSSFIVTLIWAKKLTNNLKPMLKASERIANQDLDFEIEGTDIKEFNTVLKGLEDMKLALAESLRKEWIQEENRKNQISALAHDLKTPISIVNGNACLLEETELTEEQRQYVEYIIKNSNRIADYTEALMIVNKTSKINKAHFEKIDSIKLVNNIIENAEELSLVSNNKIDKKINIVSKEMFVDLSLIERVVNNIISNAINYSPEGSTINLGIRENQNFLEIEIADQGKGFSKADLVHAKDQFYRGDKSRNSPTNYGIGLYIADEIVKLHKGELILKNRQDQQGALVLIRIPINGRKLYSCSDD